MGNLKKCEKCWVAIAGDCTSLDVVTWTNVASWFMVVIRCRITYALQALRIRKCRDIQLLLFLAQAKLVADDGRHIDAEVVRDLLQHIIGILPIPHLWVDRCRDILEVSICCENRLMDLRGKCVSQIIHYTFQ